MFFRKINRKEFGIACTYLESPLPSCPAELSGADGSTIFESITVHSMSQSAEESSGAGEADCLPPRGKVVELYQRSPPFQPRLDSREKKISNLTHEIEMKNKLFNDYVGIMKKMEQCIIEKNTVIAEKDKRISELTDKAAAFENFAERLNMLFAVFEDNANISIVQKVASGLFGKK